MDPAGNVVGTTYRAQTTGALRNLHAALAAAGAEQADMTSMTWYVVDYTEEVLTELYLGSSDRQAETGEPPLPTALTPRRLLGALEGGPSGGDFSNCRHLSLGPHTAQPEPRGQHLLRRVGLDPKIRC